MFIETVFICTLKKTVYRIDGTCREPNDLLGYKNCNIKLDNV